MLKVKLFSQVPVTAGRLITLPIIGDTQFDLEENSIEVDENIVEELLAKDFGVKLHRATNKKKLVEKTEVNETFSTEEMLSALSKEEIEVLLSSYPKYQTSKLTTKEKKIEYLVKKM